MPKFPFPTPNLSRRYPAAVTNAEAACLHDAEVIEWFVQNRGGASVTFSAPIVRMVSSLKSFAAGGLPSVDPGASSMSSATGIPGIARSVAADAYAAHLMAHAIGIIEGQHRDGQLSELVIHANFVNAELGSADSSRSGHPALPGGIGTLLAAAECARVGGEKLEILGARSKSLDIEFRSGKDAVLRIESKTRAAASAFAPDATPDTLARWALDHVMKAGHQLRERTKHDKIAALQIVWISAFVPVFLGRALHGPTWEALLVERIGRAGRPRPNPFALPHAVATRWLTLDIDQELNGKPDAYFSWIELLRYVRPRPPVASIDLVRRMFHVA